MTELFTLDQFLTEAGLADKKIALPEKKVVASTRNETPKDKFIAFVGKQLAKATEFSKSHPFTGDIIPEPIGDLKPPTRGKSSNWFVYKNNQLVVSAYASNTTLFEPVAFASWDHVIKYFEYLKTVALAGKLDANFAEIQKTRDANRGKSKKAKAAKPDVKLAPIAAVTDAEFLKSGQMNPETGEIMP